MSLGAIKVSNAEEIVPTSTPATSLVYVSIYSLFPSFFLHLCFVSWFTTLVFKLRRFLFSNKLIMTTLLRMCLQISKSDTAIKFPSTNAFSSISSVQLKKSFGSLKKYMYIPITQVILNTNTKQNFEFLSFLLFPLI